MPRQWDIKRRVGAFFVTFIFVFAVFGFMYSDVQKAKADVVSDIIKYVVTALNSDGTVAASTALDPGLVVVIAATAVLTGVQFQRDTQMYSFCQWLYQHSFDTSTPWGTLFVNGVHSGKYFWATTQAGATFIKQSFLTWIAQITGQTQAVTTLYKLTIPAGNGTDNYSYTTKTIKLYQGQVLHVTKLQCSLVNPNQYCSSVQTDGVLAYINISGTKVYPSIIVPFHGGSTNTLSFNDIYFYANSNSVQYKNQTMTVTYPCDLTIVGRNLNTIPVDIGYNLEQSDTSVCGDWTHANSDGSSQNSISTDKPVSVSYPTETAADIPVSDVVGQTSDTIADTTSISNDIPSDTTSDTPANPPYTQPTTKIDWSPLMNIQLFDKFPFCLPWDLKTIVSGLVAPPKAPKWDIDIPMSALHMPDWKYTVDFSQYQTAVYVIRYGELLLATGGLIFAMYKIMKH